MYQNINKRSHYEVIFMIPERHLGAKYMCEISQALQKIDIQGLVTCLLFTCMNKQTDNYHRFSGKIHSWCIYCCITTREYHHERLCNDQTEYIPTFPCRHVSLFNFQSDGRTLQSGLCLCKRKYAGWKDKGWDRSYMCEMPDSHVIWVYKNDHESYVDAK